MSLPRKIVNIATIASCLGFIFVGFYVYSFRGASLQLLILDILFFGTGAIVSIISLISVRKSWAIDVKRLTKAQSIIISICGIIFSICSLFGASFFRLHIVLKIILFFGFVSLGKWSIILLLKQKR